MRRKEFFKKLGLGIGAIAIAPSVIESFVEEETPYIRGDFSRLGRTSGTYKYADYTFNPYKTHITKIRGEQHFVENNVFQLGDIVFTEPDQNILIVNRVETNSIFLETLGNRPVAHKDAKIICKIGSKNMEGTA